MSFTHSICVFCGARGGDDPAFAHAATDLGQRMAANGWRLVYGAGDVGIMGSLANAAQGAGGVTFGVIPKHLVDWEVGKTDLTQYIVTDDMHSRKKLMFVNSDAAVVLPGGAGTLDEFFEVLTWAQLGLHRRPILLCNIAGYWDPLLALIDHTIDRGFADASLCDLFTVVKDVEDVEGHLKVAFAMDSKTHSSFPETH